jgi:hypothetical protein
MHAFVIANYMVYVLYIVAYLGLWRKAPEYLDMLRTLLKLYVGCVLVWTFNPFVAVASAGINKQVAFSAGLFVLAGLSLDKIQAALTPVFPGLIL